VCCLKICRNSNAAISWYHVCGQGTDHVVRVTNHHTMLIWTVSINIISSNSSRKNCNISMECTVYRLQSTDYSLQTTSESVSIYKWKISKWHLCNLVCNANMSTCHTGALSNQTCYFLDFCYQTSLNKHPFNENHWVVTFKKVNQLDALFSQIFYLTFIYSSTYFGRPYAHCRSSTTAVTASGFTVGAWW